MFLPFEFTVQTCAPMFFTLIICPLMGLTGSVIVTSPPEVSQRIVKSVRVAVYALFLVTIAMTTVPREKSAVYFFPPRIGAHNHFHRPRQILAVHRYLDLPLLGAMLLD